MWSNHFSIQHFHKTNQSRLCVLWEKELNAIQNENRQRKHKWKVNYGLNRSQLEAIFTKNGTSHLGPDFDFDTKSETNVFIYIEYCLAKNINRRIISCVSIRLLNVDEFCWHTEALEKDGKKRKQVPEKGNYLNILKQK